MAQKNNNVIPMTFDDAFYRKMANQKFKQREYKRAAEYFEVMAKYVGQKLLYYFQLPKEHVQFPL